MTELFRAAWTGWRSLAASGKLEAALLISLLALWVYYKKVKQKPFLIYITAVTILCILPVTAAGLMLYQTRFYDYRWIWSIVPVTAAVSFAAVLFLAAAREEGEGGGKRQGAAAVLLAAGLIFCGGMGAPPRNLPVDRTERLQAQAVLEKVRERMPGREICLWAPAVIMRHARAYDAQIQLLYGRDMWDLDLGAYSYDKYPEEFRDLYRWMEDREGRMPDSGCVETVLSGGVNCILISADQSEAAVRRLEEMLGAAAEKLDGYYLLIR